MWKELEGKNIGVFDAETDGLLEEVTKMHCASVVCAIHKAEFETASPKTLIDRLNSYDVLVGHNIIGYDLPMLELLYGWSPRADVIVIDTLWLSRMYHPDIEGGHSLGAWGARLGNPKTEYYPVHDPEQPVYDPSVEDPSKDPRWVGSIYTRKMQEYCTQDVKVTVEVFWKFVGLLKNFSWQSIKCEMDTARLIQRQMQHGFVFDKQGAEVFHAKLVEQVIDIEDEVHQTLVPIAKFVREVQPSVKKDGTLSSVRVKCLGDKWEAVVPTPEFTIKETKPRGFVVCDPEDFGAFPNDDGKWYREAYKAEHEIEYHSGSFSLITWEEFSLGSRQQIAERLQRAGYKLTKMTEKGNFIIDDVVLQEAADAGISVAKPLAKYFMIQKVEAMVKNWLGCAKWHKDQGVWRIHGYVNSMGANTNRMTHSSPNVAQVPATKADKAGNTLWGIEGAFGADCRKLFGVRKGYKLVGCDASGLELRTLANYMNDDKYTETLLTGDIHTANQIAAGLPTRNNAKTFIYAFLYGGGDAKIGSIVGGGAKEGKKLKEAFLERTPALKKLREGVLAAAKNRGWLKGFDGRILRVRSPHSALNTLLQGMGAIVMKYWLIEVARVADAEGLDWNPSANVHDEGQFEVLEAHAERFAQICVESFPVISKALGSKCLLEGEAKIGNTWYECH